MRRHLLALAIGTAVVGLGAVAYYFPVRFAQNPPNRQPQVGQLADKSPARRFGFGPQYVGSQSCKECHAEISAEYETTHSMARSSRPIGEESVVEDDSIAVVRPPGSREYLVRKTSHNLTHSELMRDVTGKTIYDQAEGIRFEIGSGNRGRAFLLQRDGFLFQSPISWYTQKNTWGLSPGYLASNHQRFDRKMTIECVYCHVGRPDVADASCHRFAPMPFLESGIGCERCHGPGREHVTQEHAGDGDRKDFRITQPAKLDAARRDSVCFQCHLRSRFIFPRSQREHYDFVPGERFEDNWVAFVSASRDLRRATSVVEQFRASSCFQKSDGKLGCISCHDPHSRPAESERLAFYHERCSKCHAPEACTAAVERQRAAPANGSCVYCHMPPLPTKGIPHTALTDHRILRISDAEPLISEESSDPLFQLEIFRSDPQTRVLSKHESDRAWALLYASQAAFRQDLQLAQRAASWLQPSASSPEAVIHFLANDALALERLAVAYAMVGNEGVANACWNRLSQLQPTNEAALRSEAMFRLSKQESRAGLQTVQKLLEVNPHFAQYHWLHSQLLQQSDRVEEAIRAAEKAVQLNPTDASLHAWLGDAYAKTGNARDAQRHREFETRIQQANSSSPQKE